MADNKLLGIIGVLSVIIASGTTYMLTSEKDYTYICPSTQEVGVFYGGISSTGITAYPYKENRTGYKRCGDGWILLDTYLEDNNIIIPKPLGHNGGTRYSCNNINCTQIS